MEKEVTKLIYDIHGKAQVLDERTQSILRETTKTNGRVTKLEDKVDSLDTTIAEAKGQAKGISLVIGAIFTLLNIGIALFKN